MCEVMRAPFLAIGSLAIWTRISCPSLQQIGNRRLLPRSRDREPRCPPRSPTALVATITPSRLATVAGPAAIASRGRGCHELVAQLVALQLRLPRSALLQLQLPAPVLVVGRSVFIGSVCSRRSLAACFAGPASPSATASRGKLSSRDVRPVLRFGVGDSCLRQSCRPQLRRFGSHARRRFLRRLSCLTTACLTLFFFAAGC